MPSGFCKGFGPHARTRPSLRSCYPSRSLGLLHGEFWVRFKGVQCLQEGSLLYPSHPKP